MRREPASGAEGGADRPRLALGPSTWHGAAAAAAAGGDGADPYPCPCLESGRGCAGGARR